MAETPHDWVATTYGHGDATCRYGRVKFSTIQEAKNELRRAIQSEGTPLIQEIWDRLEQWIDSPPMNPRRTDNG